MSDPYFLPHFGDLPPFRYQIISNRLPPGYVGSLSAAISTYTLSPTLEVAAKGTVRRTGHPFSVFVSPALEPFTVRVRDVNGKIAKSVAVK